MKRKTPTIVPDSADRICELLGEGIPLRQILREQPNMPGVTAFYARLDEKSTQYDAALAERITQARARGFDQIALDCLHIADDNGKDTRIVAKGTEHEREVADSDWIARSKLRVETRLKLLAKWDPKRYGDKVTTELTGAGGAPIEFSEVRRIVVDPILQTVKRLELEE